MLTHGNCVALTESFDSLRGLFPCLQKGSDGRSFCFAGLTVLCVINRDLATIRGLLVLASSWLSPVHRLPVQVHPPSLNLCPLLTPVISLLQGFARRKLGST